MRKEFSDLPSTSEEGLAWLQNKFNGLRDPIAEPLDLPEAAFKLDLESRAPDQTRMVKHLQQLCLLHATAFVRSNQIKLLHMIDAYLKMAQGRNPSGVYACARSLLEFNAFLYEVQRRLAEASSGDEKNWRPRGEAFFKQIVRARFGTSDPQMRKLLIDSKIPKSCLDPLNIMNCIKTLSSEPEFSDISQRYNCLCDYVHHNLSSQTISNEGTFVSDVARSKSGGEVHTLMTVPVTRYAYPAESKADKSINDTISGAVLDQEAAVVWLNECRDSPFTADELIKWTGSEFGVVEIRDRSELSRRKAEFGAAKVGRNDPCPCGSNKKYKNCCLRRNA